MYYNHNISRIIFNVLGLCSATADIWTGKQRKNSFLGLTVHYPAVNGSLTRRFLFLALLPKNQRKESQIIRKTIENKFIEIGLSKQLQNIIFVTDGGKNIVKPIELIGAKRMDCIEHKLNNVLKGQAGDIDIRCSRKLAIRVKITDTLDGDGREPFHWLTLLSSMDCLRRGRHNGLTHCELKNYLEK